MALPPDLQLAWFARALDALEAFLLSDDVFRPLGSPTLQPRLDLSLGALLLAADGLRASESPLSAAERGLADRLLRRWEIQAGKHHAAIERKALAEARQRANLWQAFVEEAIESPAEAARYPVEVRHRVALERLLSRLGDSEVSTELRRRVEATDDRARSAFLPGPFVWDSFLADVYPPPTFWFLHGSLRGTQANSHDRRAS